MSFALTKAAFLDGSKTVTRRLGWKNLKPGTRIMGVEKVMGFRKGEKVVQLGEIEVVDVRSERLCDILIEPNGTAREGFPALTAAEFVARFGKAMGVGPLADVTRIEFRHVSDAAHEGAPGS